MSGTWRASGSGRPFRFLASLIALWVGMRIFQLWPVEGTLSVAEALAPPAAAAVEVGPRGGAADDHFWKQAFPAPIAVAEPVRGPATHGWRTAKLRDSAGASWRAAPPGHGDGITPAAMPTAVAAAMPGLAQAAPGAAPASQTAVPAPGAPLSGPAAESRLRGSGWLIVRGGQAAPFVPQLGGSQAGVRLTYALDTAGRLSAAGRISTALRGRQREAAIGLDWQPTRLPVHVVVEQRIGIERARGGPSVALIGGFGPTAVAGGLMLDGYGQAGVIARDGAEGFADGAVRLSRAVATVGAARLELGLGAWGGAQRGAARLDAGPSASAVLPIAGANVRLSLEWRERLAGRAAPTSGPAVSIGTDF